MKTLFDFLQKYNPAGMFLVKFKNMKFRNKLLTSYLIIIIIPITILGTYSYMQSKNYLLDEAKQGLIESVSQITQNLNYKFSTYSTILYFLDFNNQINQTINVDYSNYYEQYIFLSTTFNPLVETVLNASSDISQISIYSNNKFLSTSATPSSPIKPLSEISNQPWFNRVIQDNKVHWIINDSQLSGFVRFYKLNNDVPLNLLRVEMDYNKVFNVEINKVKNYGIFISDSNNNILFSKNTFRDKKLVGVEKKIISLKNGEFNVNGVKCILIRDNIVTTGWNLYYYSPVSSVTIDVNDIAFATMIIVLSCFGILILMTFVFSNTFVKRINKLNQQIKIVEDGNLKIEVYSNSRDEIGGLSNSFGKMLNKINTLIDEVYHSKLVQKEAELKALQAQINPHFLYNALSLINWKAITIDAMEISQLTNNISKFYRTILNGGKNVISVKDEVSNIKCYIQIQLEFHKNSFDVEYIIEDDIYNYHMINMVLQPIVENAIDHGIDHKREGRGKLTIRGYIEYGHIFFSVQDNGPGMEKEKIDAVFLSDEGGYGLKNVHERLKIFFGEKFGISITSEKGSNTCVTIEIPLYSQPMTFKS